MEYEHHIYRYPELYYHIHFPDDDYVSFIGSLINQHGNRGTVLLDPACGPGNLLQPFADSFTLLGNDIDHGMTEYAKEMLSTSGIQTSNLDMMEIDLLERKVDVILNGDNTIMHVGTLDRAREHLVRAARILNPGGIYILGVTLTIDREALGGEGIFSAYTIDVSDKACSVEYRFLGDEPEASRFHASFAVKLSKDNKNFFEMSYEFVVNYMCHRSFSNLLQSIDEEYEVVAKYAAGETIEEVASFEDVHDGVIVVLRRRDT